MSSNLINHLKSEIHYDTIYQEFLALEKSSLDKSHIRSPAAKRPRSSIEPSVLSSNQLLSNMGITSKTKYKVEGSMQQERLLKVVTMIVECICVSDIGCRNAWISKVYRIYRPQFYYAIGTNSQRQRS